MILDELYYQKAVVLKDRLIALRKENGWIQADLASNSGVSRRTIIDIENNKANPELETLVRLSNAFNCPIVSLFTENPGFRTELGNISKQLEIVDERITLGKRILQVATHRKLDMLGLSVLSQIEYSNLFAYINGEINMSLWTIYKITNALEISFEEIFDYTGSLPDNVGFKGMVD